MKATTLKGKIKNNTMKLKVSFGDLVRIRVGFLTRLVSLHLE